MQIHLMAAAAQKYRMFLCVQDLTCPGASFIHSAGIAAHVPGITCVEGNARQYMPAANEPWESGHDIREVSAANQFASALATTLL